MLETATPSIIQPDVAGDFAEPTEQENEQLLKDLKTTIDSFKVLFSKQRPALCHALEVVLKYCQDYHTNTFATRDLTRRYGAQAIRIKKPGVGEVTTGHWAADHRFYWNRQKKDPQTFISNTYHIMTFMRQIINLIAKQNDPVKFPVTFQLQRPNTDGREQAPYTCRAVRNN